MSFIPEVKMDFIPDDITDDESEIGVEEIEEIEDFDQEKDAKGRSQSDTYKAPKHGEEEIEEDETPSFEAPEKIPKIPKIPKAKSKRDDMDVNDIFNMPQAVIDPPNMANVKLTKKGKPRKKRPPMTEEHKAKLALAREKAMASRKKKAQEKKENKALELEEKELLKKQKVKRVRKLKEEVGEDDETAAPSAPSQTIKEKTFSKQDLEEAQLQAIMNYEKIRKSRKEKKKIEQEKNKEQEALRNQIRRAVAPPQKEYNNPFQNCY